MVRDFQSWANRQKAPVAMGICGSLIVSSLYFWFMRMRGMDAFIFDRDWLSRPWTLITYPWAYMPLVSPFGLIGIIFLIMWISWMGPSIEQSMGSLRFAGFMLTMTALPALCLEVGALLLNAPHIPLSGPWLPVAGLTLAWCTRNPTAQISLWGVIPLSGKWLGWLETGIVFFTLGFGSPVLGLFACGHLAVAWAFAANRLPLAFGGGRQSMRLIGKENIPATRGSVRYDDKYYDEVRRREQERADQERLRKLFGDPPEDDGTSARR